MTHEEFIAEFDAIHIAEALHRMVVGGEEADRRFEELSSRKITLINRYWEEWHDQR
jgi:hypothetical protein